MQIYGNLWHHANVIKGSPKKNPFYTHFKHKTIIGSPKSVTFSRRSRLIFVFAYGQFLYSAINMYRMCKLTQTCLYDKSPTIE